MSHSFQDSGLTDILGFPFLIFARIAKFERKLLFAEIIPWLLRRTHHYFAKFSKVLTSFFNCHFHPRISATNTSDGYKLASSQYWSLFQQAQSCLEALEAAKAELASSDEKNGERLVRICEELSVIGKTMVGEKNAHHFDYRWEIRINKTPPVIHRDIFRLQLANKRQLIEIYLLLGKT